MTPALAIPTSLAAIDREGFAAFVLRMRAAGIGDKPLLEAIEATPRRAFVDPQYHDAAWSSRIVPIDCGETIEGLDQQALILSALGLEPQNRVLEIGTGSGYTAAVMGAMVKRVYTIERFARLHQAAQARFRALKRDNVIASQADGAAGSTEGPFDRIVVWPAMEALPRGFSDLVVPGGIIVCPVGEGDGRQVLVRLTKVGNRFEREDIGTVRVQPMASGLPRAL
ncbi:protein-L-isoaspartate(D-aspartate) O-methyltransferase [Oceaniradius stylonematis]|uniref:protein-L-isoaspartate(D-aspartate) O-methyltransferase n=1 Tax=Oceaniradius stylonematis TaxID=2184161 RepID=UPI00273E95D0|nr:protein-L-isoaspartate(D-aspartate) O-methyltransferase [Oceaniradius stylonematis]